MTEVKLKVSLSPLSVRVRPAEGSALPRSAVHHRHPRLLLLLRSAQGHEGESQAPLPCLFAFLCGFS